MGSEKGVFKPTRALSYLPAMSEPFLNACRFVCIVPGFLAPKFEEESMDDEGGEALAYIGVDHNAKS